MFLSSYQPLVAGQTTKSLQLEEVAISGGEMLDKQVDSGGDVDVQLQHSDDKIKLEVDAKRKELEEMRKKSVKIRESEMIREEVRPSHILHP